MDYVLYGGVSGFLGQLYAPLVVDQFHDDLTVLGAILRFAATETRCFRPGSFLAVMTDGTLPYPPQVVFEAFVRAFHRGTRFLSVGVGDAGVWGQREFRPDA